MERDAFGILRVASPKFVPRYTYTRMDGGIFRGMATRREPSGIALLVVAGIIVCMGLAIANGLR